MFTRRQRQRLFCENLEDRRVLAANTMAVLSDGQLIVTGDDEPNLLEIARVDVDDIVDPTTIPHVSIEGTGDGTFDYYSFTVSEAGSRGIFDIDYENIDSSLLLYDDAGSLLAYNDDLSGFLGFSDPGTNGTFVSLLQYSFPAAGTYTIGVGKWYSYDDGGELTGAPLEEGDVYTLHVSIENHELNEPGENVVAEVEPNDPRANAQNIDNAGWNLEGSPASVVVRPLQGTTVNGSVSPATFPASDVVDLVLRSKQGDDFVDIHSLFLEGEISLDTGNGHDEVSVQSTQAVGDLSIDTRQGNDLIQMAYTAFGGDTILETREGNDAVFILYENSFSGDVTVNMGQGNDFFNAFLPDIRYFFGGDVNISMGEGNDEVFIDYVFSELFIAGDLSIDLGNGDDVLSLFGFTLPGPFASGTAHIGGSVLIVAGNGNDLVSIDSLVVAGDLLVLGGPGEDGPFAELVIGADVSVDGQLIVNGFEN